MKLYAILNHGWLSSLLPVLVILLVTFQGGFAQDPSRTCDITCEEIVDPLCHFAVYTYTGFPNLLGHTEQGYVQQYDHLIEVLKLCYDKSLHFLCGILVPHCVEGKGLMLPTRKMCRDFHDGCDAFLEEAGQFKVDCDDLPLTEDEPPRCIHFPTKAPGPMHTFPPHTTSLPYCDEQGKGTGVSSSSYSLTLLALTSTASSLFVSFYHNTC